MKVIALIGDILGSRKTQNREKLQKLLQDTLIKVNEESGSLLSPHTITLGDEFQAVYKNADYLFQDLWKILFGTYPHKIRFSMGIGNLTTAVNPNQAIGMDGPAFHFARNGIHELKKSPFLYQVSSGKQEREKIINGCLNLISHISANWEKNRYHILLELMEGKSIKEMAQELGISTVAVYKNINAGALDVIKILVEETCNEFNSWLEDK